MKEKTDAGKKGKPSLKKVVWFSVAASVLLLVTNTAIWINNQVFNTANFTETVTTSLTSESSRVAIAQQITDKMFFERPVAKRVAGNFTVNVLSGLLATDQFNNLLNPAVQRIQAYTTSNKQEDVALELGGVKDVITRVTNVSETLGKEVIVDVSNIPDSVILVNAENVPDLYKIGIIFLWMAPIAFILSIVLLAYPYVKKSYDNKKVLIIQATTVTLFGLFGLLIGPLFKPSVLANIKDIHGRVVVGNIYDAFIGSFNNQTLLLIYFAVTAIFAGIIWYCYPLIKQLATVKKK